MAEYKVPLEFGLKIRMLRDEAGLTSTQFVRELQSKVGLKITVGYMTYIEHRGVIPHERVVRKFAKFFNVDPVMFFDIIKSIKLAKYIEKLNKKYK
ncbi:hypothetical protein AGMMS49543_27530 [Betaproteobacteria bacterium]|nr:hypothetical protein AGMMS49543_27530 [Betaproteobacteria bacterium]